MKIKTKKTMNLPQLIEWAWENKIENKEYPCVGFESKTVIFNGIGWAEFSDEFSYNLTDTFTVEVEEEITEDTVIPKLIEVYLNDANNTFAEPHRDRTIKQIQDEGGCKSLAFYILNDDLTMTLIWRDGKLVE